VTSIFSVSLFKPSDNVVGVFMPVLQALSRKVKFRKAK
jgi:hypothetical protein